jgi:hypothetical protein
LVGFGDESERWQSAQSIMPQLYQTKIWQICLPDGWKVWELRFNGATIFKPNGIGQIFVRVCSPESERHKLHPAGHERFSGKLRGITGIHRGRGTFRRFWWLSCRGRGLMVSYSCASSFAEVERQEVEEIVRNLAESDAQGA